VGHALRAAGVDAILLKGPVISTWLYDAGEQRGYLDADLLVAPSRIPAAEAVLARIGFALKDPEGERDSLISGPHAQTWSRTDGAIVDLHHSLPGEVLAEGVVWPALWKRSLPMVLAGTHVQVLDPGARALLVALHAMHHGVAAGQPLEDLRRAVARLPHGVWADAADLAGELMALPQFATGLELLPEGRPIVAGLGLPSGERLNALDGQPLTTGYERLMHTRGLRPRAALVRKELAPSVAFMHWWAPWSRRSRVALAAAYAYRTAWLAAHAVPAWRAWRRGRGGR
jgi:hypothetical protein